ncbi:MAG: iron-sulfur cluster assembly accessory protein [Armatimonadetes bacterium]|nr:MAG: iron-sulfur cluster assembly accessory protein [Armatimonadota bacterium]
MMHPSRYEHADAYYLCMPIVPDPIVSIDDDVLPMLLDIRAREDDAEDLGLVVSISGVGDGVFTYGTAFMRVDSALDTDLVYDNGSLPIVVSEADASNLQGAVLTKSKNLLTPGLTIDNPNTPSPSIAAGMVQGDLTGTVAENVSKVIAEAINPSIASHGGRAELVAVEESTAYVRLGGGCVGCGMASVTLSQGIESTIVSLVPEISKVVDVTDHAQGENPYYEQAKK